MSPGTTNGRTVVATIAKIRNAGNPGRLAGTGTHGPGNASTLHNRSVETDSVSWIFAPSQVASLRCGAHVWCSLEQQQKSAVSAKPDDADMESGEQTGCKRSGAFCASPGCAFPFRRWLRLPKVPRDPQRSQLPFWFDRSPDLESRHLGEANAILSSLPSTSPVRSQ